MSYYEEKGLSDEDVKKYLLSKDYLDEKGWLKSVERADPVDGAGNPVPWITYEATEYLDKILNKEMCVFEYGCGSSTLWLSKRVKTVHTCEHDKSWADKIALRSPPNVAIYCIDLVRGGDYCKKVSSLNIKFDLILIDGRDRINCIKNSVQALSLSGTLVLDNSDLVEYKHGIDFLVSSGFKKADFYGMGPKVPTTWCTSFFTKE